MYTWLAWTRSSWYAKIHNRHTHTHRWKQEKKDVCQKSYDINEDLTFTRIPLRCIRQIGCFICVFFSLFIRLYTVEKWNENILKEIFMTIISVRKNSSFCMYARLCEWSCVCFFFEIQSTKMDMNRIWWWYIESIKWMNIFYWQYNKLYAVHRDWSGCLSRFLCLFISGWFRTYISHRVAHTTEKSYICQKSHNIFDILN